MSEANIRQLLAYEPFQQYAREIFEQHGLQPPADAGAQYLAALRDVDPQGFSNLVGRAPLGILAHKQRGERLEKLNAALPREKVVEAWKALREDAGLRAAAKRPEVQQRVKENFARLGFAPLPGMTEAETMLAYINAAESPAHADLLQEVTGGEFGGKDRDRLARWHVTESGTVDTVAHMDKLQADQDKARGIKRDKAAPPPPEDSVRGEVARAYKEQMRNHPDRAEEKVYLRNRADLDANLAYDGAARRAGSPRSVRYEESPQLREELVKEFRDNQVVRAEQDARRNDESGQ